MHKAKVNTKNSDSTSSGSKNPILPPEYVGRIETPFGVQYVNRGDALDHAHMRSGQLASLLGLVHGEGLDRFMRLDDGTQHNIMWLAAQLAEETEAMFDIVARDLAGSTA